MYCTCTRPPNMAFIVYIAHASVLSIMNSSASWETILNISLKRESIVKKKNHMVTGNDLGHIKVPEYLRAGRNIIRTSLNIFFTPGVETWLLELCYMYDSNKYMYMFVFHANYLAIRNRVSTFQSRVLYVHVTLLVRHVVPCMFWTTLVNLLWSLGREAFILGATLQYLST